VIEAEIMLELANKRAASKTSSASAIARTRIGFPRCSPSLTDG
jgi:hypothetical protein